MPYSTFNYAFEAGQVVSHRGDVGEILLIAHVWLAENRKHHFAAIGGIGHHAHGDVNPCAVGGGHGVIKNTIWVPRLEFEMQRSQRGGGTPGCTIGDNFCDERTPFRKTRGVREVVIKLIGRALDGNADSAAFSHQIGNEARRGALSNASFDPSTWVRARARAPKCARERCRWREVARQARNYDEVEEDSRFLMSDVYYGFIQ